MEYEMAVLGAINQIKDPNTPKISETTGISSKRIQTAIKKLKELLGINIQWHGAKRNGFYVISSWGELDSSAGLKAKTKAWDLEWFKNKKELVIISVIYKESLFEETKRENYLNSLRLEGLDKESIDLKKIRYNFDQEKKKLDIQMRKTKLIKKYKED